MASDLDTSTEAATRDPSDTTPAGDQHKASGGRPVLRGLANELRGDGGGPATFFTVAASLAAIIYSAQGMIGFATDIINTPLYLAWFIACFLELALVATAFQDRRDAIKGRSARGISTWVVSAISGCLSALHDLVKETPDGGSQLVTEPQNIISAMFRITAPLIAAYLIHRLLVSNLHAAHGMTDAQLKRDKRLHRLARATVDHGRAEAELEKAPTWAAKRREAAAHKRKDRRYDHLLKVYPATEPNFHSDIDKWLRALGAADMFTKRTNLESDAPSLEEATYIPTAAPKKRPAARRAPVASKPSPQKPAATAASTNQAPAPAPAPKPVAAPANVRQLTARPSSGGSDRDRAQELFDTIVADPGHEGWGRDGKPSAKYIHDALGLAHDDATTRRWTTKMWKTYQQELQELPESTPSPDNIDQLVADTTPTTHIQQAKEA